MTPKDSDLRSRIHTLAVSKATGLFRQSEEWRPSPDANDGCADAVPVGGLGPSDLFSIIRGPMLGRDLHEGRLIETAIALALGGTGSSVVQGKRFAVTDTDVALVANNDYANLGAVRPPAEGAFVRKFEIDVISHDKVAGRLFFIDVKRTRGDAEDEERHQMAFQAAGLAARRFFERVSLHVVETRLATIRWFASDKSASGDILSRETVDAALQAPVRETVELAVGVYRAEFDRLLTKLITRATPDGRGPEHSPKRKNSCVIVAPISATTLDEAFRLGARAGRFP